jgi:hypothetical protein
MAQVHEGPAPQDLESPRPYQERLEDILFVPKSVILHDPLSGVFGGKKDIVDVNHHPRPEAGQYLEKLELHITSDA